MKKYTAKKKRNKNKSYQHCFIYFYHFKLSCHLEGPSVYVLSAEEAGEKKGVHTQGHRLLLLFVLLVVLLLVVLFLFLFVLI